MQTPQLYVKVVKSVLYADAEYVVTTAAMATMVLPVKGVVKNIAVGSSTGAMDTHVVSAVPVHVDAGHGHHHMCSLKREHDSQHLNDASSSGYISFWLKLWRHGPECK